MLSRKVKKPMARLHGGPGWSFPLGWFPALDDALCYDQRYAPVVMAAAHLVVRRCNERRAFLDFYDAAVDDIPEIDHNHVPF